MNSLCDHEATNLKYFPGQCNEGNFMNPPTCNHETETLNYFSGQLSGTELAQAENHIASCFTCCQTLAQLTKLMSTNISEEEKAFLETNLEQSAKHVGQLIKDSLNKQPETKQTNNNNVASISAHQTKQNNSKGFFLANWKASQLAIAASIAIIFLVSIALYQLKNTKTENPIVVDARASIQEINLKGRPTKLRMASSDYSAENQTRGIELEQLKKDLLGSRLALESLVQKNPTPANRQLLAQVLLVAEDYKAAISQLSKALETDSNNPSILTDLAVAQTAQNDYSSALESINKALTINQNYLPAIFNRALIYKELTEYNNARSDWEKYLQLDPNSLWATEAKQQLNSIKQ